MQAIMESIFETSVFTAIMARAQLCQKEWFPWPNICYVSFSTFVLSMCIFSMLMIFMSLIFWLKICVVIGRLYGVRTAPCCEYSKKTALCYVLYTYHLRITIVPTALYLIILVDIPGKVDLDSKSTRNFSDHCEGVKQHCSCPVNDATIFHVRKATGHLFFLLS